MADRMDKCFEGSRESPPRLIRKEPSPRVAEEHLEKAESNLMAMELLFQNKFFGWAIVASYYSMYHAALAALWLIGLDARSHECAVLAFEKFYAKKGRVDAKYLEYLRRAKELGEKYADTLDKVRTLRVQASYGIGEIKSIEASFARSGAKEFVFAVRKIIYDAKGMGYQNV